VARELADLNITLSVQCFMSSKEAAAAKTFTARGLLFVKETL